MKTKENQKRDASLIVLVITMIVQHDKWQKHGKIASNLLPIYIDIS